MANCLDSACSSSTTTPAAGWSGRPAGAGGGGLAAQASAAGHLDHAGGPAGGYPSHHVWALDYQFDQTTDGRILQLLNVVDEHTREALAITVDRRIDADATVAVLDRLVAERRTAPRLLRCDNGPELTANALRDWCRFTGCRDQLHRARRTLAEPYVESFGSRLRDELLAVEAFTSLLEAWVLVEDWRIEDNTLRPHSALGSLTPTDYATTWTTNHPAPS